MAGTRSGKTNYKVGPEHQGRYAVANGTFSSSGRKKRKTDDLRATRRQTTEDVECQKRIKIGKPSLSTPTKEELVNLPRPTRHSKHCCLHYGIERPACKVLFPDHFFGGNCDAYVEAMIHSTKKSLIEKDLLRFICQAGHTNYIVPTTSKANQIHHLLLVRFKQVKDDSSDDDVLEVIPPPVVAATIGGATATLTPTPEAATAPRPLITPGRSSRARTPTPPLIPTPPLLRNLQRNDMEPPANF
jgi:hypothetical protein